MANATINTPLAKINRSIILSCRWEDTTSMITKRNKNGDDSFASVRTPYIKLGAQTRDKMQKSKKQAWNRQRLTCCHTRPI
jgi:hypothetical protein